MTFKLLNLNLVFNTVELTLRLSFDLSFTLIHQLLGEERAVDTVVDPTANTIRDTGPFISVEISVFTRLMLVFGNLKP